MAHNKFHHSFSEDPTIQSSICARCGKTAEVHLSLLGSVPHRSETFCLSCGEALLQDLQKQPAVFAHSEQTSTLHPSLANTSARHLLHSDVPFDEVEDGIIFWEGHGWSSDGPFAGA
jgi:hypothetical protein